MKTNRLKTNRFGSAANTALTSIGTYIYWDGTFGSNYYDQNFGGNPADQLIDYIEIGPDYLIYNNKIALSGNSTYKWKWTAPDTVGMPGTPDLTNFPVPPLFMMGRVKSQITADAEVADPDLQADGKLIDQWTAATAL